MKSLFKVTGATYFLVAVFLNAFVDLGHKIVIQNTIFKMYDGDYQVILTAIVNGLILLPFILLFSPAGFTSDKYPKHQVMRYSAWGAVVLTIGITVCYAMGWFWPAFGMTFLLATQSAFYSPAKYGYIRGFFGKQNLASANGLVSAISIISILMGTLVFSIIFEALFPADANNEADVLSRLIPLGIALIVSSVLELVLMYQLPNVDVVPGSQTTKVSSETSDDDNTAESFNMKKYFRGQLVGENIAPIWKREVIRLPIIGLAMFWSIGQVMLAAFPAFAKAQTGETNTVAIQLVLAASGLGIAIGSMLASRLSKNYIETGVVPVGAAGIALGLAVLPGLNSTLLMGLDFLFIGIMGGLFIVPLNALIQFYAREHELGKVLAGNNLIQNIAMLLFLCITVGFTLAGISSQQLLYFTAIFAAICGCYTVYKIPQSLVRFLMSYLMSRRYRVNVQGMKYIPSRGGVLLLGNHISWVDWAIVQLACPRPVQFVMLKSIYERWYLTWFFKLFGCVPIESGAGSRKSLEIVAELLNEGKIVCLFPEGGISRTGHLAEFRRGFERAAELANDDVVIQPFYLRGLWGSQFSRSSEKLKSNNQSGWRRELIVAFGKPISKDTGADVLKRRVFDLSVSSWQSHAETLPTLGDAWIYTAKKQGGDIAIADTMGDPLSASKALTAAIAFSRRIGRLSPEKNIGLLVPTSAGGVIANMATLLKGKTIVNLNYTASPSAMQSAIEQADIKTVYTSKRFLRKLEGRGLDFSDTLKSVNLIYLEDVKNSISKTEMLGILVSIKLLPAYLLQRLYAKRISASDTAAILFSSGSEGAPKGIRLSHTNIMANLKQIADVLNTQNEDVVMASLPLFHAFGLTATQFMPLIEGLPMVCHADPTDALGVGKAVAKYRATIMCGTSTFLRLYSKNKKVHPLMFESLRVVVAGAEKLNPEVRSAFKSKFNKDILEGYGATETTPVASVNLPDSLDTTFWKVQLGGKLGTVGMPLPGTSFKIVDPQTMEELDTGEDGMILIGGAQVMQGYLNAPQKTEEVIHLINDTRWYITGDKGHLDEDGFLTIVDRYSRFAKLGGEMISLSALETALRSSVKTHHPADNEEFDIVAVNIPDEKKGEKVVVLCDQDISLAEIKSAMIEDGCNTLMIPSALIHVSSLPKLGSGKTDFSKAKSIALAGGETIE